MPEISKNIAQEKAIDHVDGPCLVISGPGSGKTTTMIRRIHHLLEIGKDPRRILMVTFSKAAAEEMQARYVRMYGKNPGIRFQTIHAFCYTVLRLEGLYGKENILSDADAKDFLFRQAKSLPMTNDAWDLALSIATEITVIKNDYIDMQSYQPKCCEKKYFLEVFNAYEEMKNSRHLIDFDDMLIKCKEFFEKNPARLAAWQKEYQYVQCDEYQDTNKIQRDILYMLTAKTHNLTCVGDDDQSIYGFRGADSSIMLNFKKDFPKAEIIEMGTNYRSANKIVHVSDVLIKKNTERYLKDLVSHRGKDGIEGAVQIKKYRGKSEELKDITSLIKKKHEQGIPYDQMAILFRTNTEVQYPVTHLSKENIPFNSLDTATTIYDSFIFSDIQSYVRLSAGCPNSQDLYRVLNRPQRYWKDSAFSHAEYSQKGFQNALYYLAKDAYWKYEAALKKADEWMNRFGPGVVTMESSPSMIFKGLCGKGSVHYDKYMEQYAKFRNMDFFDLKETYDSLLQDSKHFATIEEWFRYGENFSRFVREKSKEKDKDGVVLSTMHKAKGLEWKIVYIIDCDTGVIPHKSAKTQKEREEERRLFYVGMTRAKDELVICSTTIAPSPYLDDIKEAFVTNKGVLKSDYRSASDVPKYLAGKTVEHYTHAKGNAAYFDIGKVVRYEGDKIVIDFNGKLKKFKFPEAFMEGYLKYR